MATNQNIKDATSFPARADNFLETGGKTVGNGALVRIADAIKNTYAYNDVGDPWPVGRPDANDAAAWLWTCGRDLVKRSEERVNRDALAQPADLVD